jgi:tripartite-type tricarboxylate transporter receptor subunit TctC
MVFPSHAANPALYASLPYDSEKDFAPISMVTRVSEILLVPNSSPAKSVKDLIELAAKEQLNYASVGVGSLAHLATELFLATAGVKMTHIPPIAACPRRSKRS